MRLSPEILAYDFGHWVDSLRAERGGKWGIWKQDDRRCVSDGLWRSDVGNEWDWGARDGEWTSFSFHPLNSFSSLERPSQQISPGSDPHAIDAAVVCVAQLWSWNQATHTWFGKLTFSTSFYYMMVFRYQVLANSTCNTSSCIWVNVMLSCPIFQDGAVMVRFMRLIRWGLMLSVGGLVHTNGGPEQKDLLHSR